MNTYRTLFFCLALLFLPTLSVFGIERIVSYNVENLFDCEDDPDTQDDSFTPEGAHQWTPQKYRAKLNNAARAITAAGGWETPIVIGLCEIENACVLQDLLYRTQLRTDGYRFVHKESPDRRGIDVALAYQPSHFQLIHEEFLPVVFPGGRPTRDILYAAGILTNGDTLHAFVNHWPSRYSGELETDKHRMEAAQTLREKTDSLLSANIHAKIIIMGDFNDYPDNESMLLGLCAQSPKTEIRPDRLYNLGYEIHEIGERGSHKFGGKWGMLDQFIVSGSLLLPDSRTHTTHDGLQICNEPFLLKKDASDFAPKRAFLGTFFAYGYSDHLPIFIDLQPEIEK